MRTNSKLPNSKGFREVQVVEDFTIEQAPSTEDSILALFTPKNPQWPAFLIAQKTGIAHQTIDHGLRRLVQRGVLSKVSGVVRHEGRRVPTKLYSLNKE